MKIATKIATICSVLLLVSITSNTTTMAQDSVETETTRAFTDKGHYLITGVDLFKMDSFCDDFFNVVDTLGTSYRGSCSDGAILYNFSAGYRFNQSVSIEYGLRAGSGLEFDVDFNPGTSDSLNLSGEFDISNIHVGVRATVPAKAGIFTLKAGYHRWSLDFNARSSGTNSSSSFDGTDIFYGIGGIWDFGSGNGLAVEYSRYDIDNDGFNAISVSYVSYF